MASKPVQNSKKCLESVQNPYKNLRFDENPYNLCNAYVTFAQRYVTFRTHISMVELNEDGGLEIMGEEMVARTFPKQWNPNHLHGDSRC